MKDVLSNLHTVQVLAPVSFSNNTPLVGNIVDRTGFDSLMYSIALGSNAGTAGTYTVLLEEGNSPTLADASTVAATDVNSSGGISSASWGFADVNKTRKLGYTGSKRYTRMTITPASNAAAVLVSITAVLGNPVNAPAPNPPQ